MSNLFQKLKTSVRAAEKKPVAPCLTLAAFGKHPGWDDHIPGIGVETDALAYLKQTLYVTGLGKQIDSGAWEKLEPEKRIEGFKHLFLWIRPGHILLGELWSSTDGKGRAKYPMVLCVDGEGVAPGFLLAKIQPDLERLRVACKSAMTADQVTASCQAAQDQLRSYLTNGDAIPIESGPSLEARRQFLEHRDFKPDRLGLMRVLHELGGSKDGHHHLRVPLAGDSHTEAIQLWWEFFKLVVPAASPVLLISHRAADWIDVLIGEPQSTDFFCLQAGLKALPLTTEIPYELPPESKRNWNELEARFLGEDPLPAKPAAPTSTQGTFEAKQSDQPAISPNRRKWVQPAMVAGVFLVAILGYLLLKANLSTKAKSPEPAPVVVKEPEPMPPPPPQVLSNDSPAAPLKAVTESPATDQRQRDYQAAMTEGRAAFAKQNFAEAMSKAAVALDLRPGDSEASNLKRDASARQQELAAQTNAQKQYAQAVEAGRAAFGKKDFATTVTQADVALSIKTNDPVAAKLRAEAKSQLDLAAIAAADRQTKYDTAMKDGVAALMAKDYAGAIKQADIALLDVSGDAAAAKLKSDAQKGQVEMAAQAERDKNYKSAMDAGQKAYDGKDYDTAIKQADLALANKTGDVAATKLKNDAQARQAELAAQAERDKKYKAAMEAAQSAYDRKDYAEAIEQTGAALLIKAGDTEATELKKKATDAKDLQEAQASIERGDLDKARTLCAAHAGTSAFDELAKQIKEKASDKFDTQLEVALVRFGRLDPKKAKTAEARRETQWLGELPIQQRDQCQREVEILREGFKTSGRLDADREKKLGELKKAIDQHL